MNDREDDRSHKYGVKACNEFGTDVPLVPPKRNLELSLQLEVLSDIIIDSIIDSKINLDIEHLR